MCTLQIYLIQNGKRVKKKKTSISKSDDPVNPIWNEAFTFNLQSVYLHNAAIEVSYLNYGCAYDAQANQEDNFKVCGIRLH